MVTNKNGGAVMVIPQVSMEMERNKLPEIRRLRRNIGRELHRLGRGRIRSIPASLDRNGHIIWEPQLYTPSGTVYEGLKKIDGYLNYLRGELVPIS